MTQENDVFYNPLPDPKMQQTFFCPFITANRNSRLVSSRVHIGEIVFAVKINGRDGIKGRKDKKGNGVAPG